MLSPDEVIAEIDRRLGLTADPLRVYWVHVPSARDSYASDIRRMRGDVPVQPLIVGPRGFDNPNALLFDLVELLEANRSELEAMSIPLAGRHALKCSVLLLAKAELRCADTSSQIQIPPWFPVAAGTQATLQIEDLTWSTESSLTPDAVGSTAICSDLFALEGELRTRLKKNLAMHHRRCNALLDHLCNVGAVQCGLAEHLERAETAHQAVKSPESFRPSLSRAFVVSGLWALALASSADNLLRPAAALAEALGLTGESPGEWQESIVSVLGRTHQPEREADNGTRFARNLILAISCACQLVTASHHADEYPRFSRQLVHSISLDLHAALETSCRVLRTTHDTGEEAE